MIKTDNAIIQNTTRRLQMKILLVMILIPPLIILSIDGQCQRVGLELKDGRNVNIKISATSNSALYSRSGTFNFVDIAKAHFETEDPNSKVYGQMREKGVAVDFLYQPGEETKPIKQVFAEPFKGANTILINVGKENKLYNHLKWANHLLESGYEIEKHDDALLTLSTTYTRVDHTSLYYKISSFLNEDGKIRIRVYIFMDISASLAPNGIGDDWEYGNQSKNGYSITYNDFIGVIRSFGYPIEFSTSIR